MQVRDHGYKLMCQSCRQEKWFFVSIYLFILSDYFIRTFPLVYISYLIAYSADENQNNMKYYVWRLSFFLIIFLLVGFEIVLDKMMRLQQYSNYKISIKYAWVMLFSLFLHLFSSFDFLDNIVNTIQFGKLMLEHGIRMVISFGFLLFSILYGDKIFQQKQDLQTLTTLWVVAVLINLVCGVKIKSELKMRKPISIKVSNTN